jgi:hypothetical protein
MKANLQTNVDPRGELCHFRSAKLFALIEILKFNFIRKVVAVPILAADNETINLN